MIAYQWTRTPAASIQTANMYSLNGIVDYASYLKYKTDVFLHLAFSLEDINSNTFYYTLMRRLNMHIHKSF